jgi:O-antigen/teichoic acid export membrane protein
VNESGESIDQRNDRNLSDLLQELRVAGLGVQVLFGFLLSLPFTVRFTKLDGRQRDLYETALLLAALSIGLLVSPVAYHRWVFRRHEKGRLLRTANVLALAGLASVGLAVCGSVLLVLSFVEMGWIASFLAAMTLSAVVFLWFALPLYSRHHPPPDGETNVAHLQRSGT